MAPGPLATSTHRQIAALLFTREDLARRLIGKVRNPRGLTFITRHSRSTRKAPRCSSTNLNLTAFFRMSLHSQGKQSPGLFSWSGSNP